MMIRAITDVKMSPQVTKINYRIIISLKCVTYSRLMVEERKRGENCWIKNRIEKFQNNFADNHRSTLPNLYEKLL